MAQNEKCKKKKEDEFKIEDLQNFVNYSKINPINIQINNSEIENALAFYSSRYRYRFIAHNLLFSSSIQQDTNVIFLATSGLNDAKDILINRKIVKGIGVIYISEISGWQSIKKISHWANAVFFDSNYPVAAKHFAFGFQRTELHSHLNFEYSILDDEGKQVKFQKGEDKTLALNFTIQIIS